MGRTVIIGGGGAGLAAAYVLENAGVECTVLEQRDFAGGRIFGKTREGHILDAGAQFLFSRYRTTFELLERLGMRDEVVKFGSELAVMRNGKIHQVSLDPRGVMREPLRNMRSLRMYSLSGQLNMARLVLELFRLRKRLDFDDPLKAADLDVDTFSRYVQRKFGEEVLDYFAQPLISCLALASPDEVNPPTGLAFAWYLIAGLFTPRNGIGSITRALAANLADLRLGTTAKKIVMEGKTVKGVEIADGKKTAFIEADNVICATLAGQAAELAPDLSAGIRDVLSGLRYSACTHVMLGIPGRPFGDIWAIAVPRKEGFCFAGVSENAIKAEGYAPRGKGTIHVYTYSEHASRMLGMSDGEVLDEVMDGLRRMNPGFPDPDFCEIFRWPEAVFLAGPGDISRVQSVKQAVREYGGLHLAGEYLGIASVEAAINSGVKAAEGVLAGGR